MVKRWFTNGIYNANVTAEDGSIVDTTFYGSTTTFGAFADATGMQVKVHPGAALIEGVHAESTTRQTLAVAPADATNPRIDRVILRLAVASPATISLGLVTGAPAASPNPPALRNDATFVDVPVATVRVEAGASTITADKVTDGRIYSRPATARLPQKLPQQRVTSYNVTLDSNGNGFTDTQTPLHQFIGAWVNAADPASGGGYPNYPIISLLVVGGQVRLVYTEGPPGATLGFHMRWQTLA